MKKTKGGFTKHVKVTFFCGKSDEEVDDLNQVACVSHWFGVSTISFSRLVGFIRGLELNLFARADPQHAPRDGLPRILRKRQERMR